MNDSIDDTATIETHSVGLDGFEYGSQSTVANIWQRSLALEGPAQLVLLDRLHQPFYLTKHRKPSNQELEARDMKRSNFLAQQDFERQSKTGLANRSRIISEVSRLSGANNIGSKKERELEAKLMAPFRRGNDPNDRTVANDFISHIKEKNAKLKPPKRQFNRKNFNRPGSRMVPSTSNINGTSNSSSSSSSSSDSDDDKDEDRDIIDTKTNAISSASQSGTGRATLIPTRPSVIQPRKDTVRRSSISLGALGLFLDPQGSTGQEQIITPRGSIRAMVFIKIVKQLNCINILRGRIRDIRILKAQNIHLWQPCLTIQRWFRIYLKVGSYVESNKNRAFLDVRKSIDDFRQRVMAVRLLHLFLRDLRLSSSALKSSINRFIRRVMRLQRIIRRHLLGNQAKLAVVSILFDCVYLTLQPHISIAGRGVTHLSNSDKSSVFLVEQRLPKHLRKVKIVRLMHLPEYHDYIHSTIDSMREWFQKCFSGRISLDRKVRREVLLHFIYRRRRRYIIDVDFRRQVKLEVPLLTEADARALIHHGEDRLSDLIVDFELRKKANNDQIQYLKKMRMTVPKGAFAPYSGICAQTLPFEMAQLFLEIAERSAVIQIAANALRNKNNALKQNDNDPNFDDGAFDKMGLSDAMPNGFADSDNDSDSDGRIESRRSEDSAANRTPVLPGNRPGAKPFKPPMLTRKISKVSSSTSKSNGPTPQQPSVKKSSVARSRRS